MFSIENAIVRFVLDDRVDQRPLGRYGAAHALLNVNGQCLRWVLTAVGDQRGIKLVAIAQPRAVDAHPLRVLGSVQQAEYHRCAVIGCVQFNVSGTPHNKVVHPAAANAQRITRFIGISRWSRR